MSNDVQELKRALTRVLGVAENLQDGLINATEDFDDPYDGEERQEDDEILEYARELLK